MRRQQLPWVLASVPLCEDAEMSEEREKKDDSQPDTGLPRVQDRRQVRAGEGGGGRARQRGEAVSPGRLWPGDALARG